MTVLLRAGSDNVLRLRQLRDMRTGGDFENDATILATIHNAAGVLVVADVELEKVAAVDGLYEGVLDSAVALVAGQRYRVTIDVDAGAGNTATETEDAIAV